MGIAFCVAGSACLGFGGVVVVIVGDAGTGGERRGRGRGRGRRDEAEMDGEGTREGDRGGLVLDVEVFDAVHVLGVGVGITIGIKVLVVPIIGIKAVVIVIVHVIDPVDTLVGPSRLESPRACNLLLNESAQSASPGSGGTNGCRTPQATPSSSWQAPERQCLRRRRTHSEGVDEAGSFDEHYAGISVLSDTER
ncbi:hypothetical protein OG21DRAFT_1518498 [Imleria badia]|nr:hypothetical protein OG21DRAFT_1518498 [Imleria badia]